MHSSIVAYSVVSLLMILLRYRCLLLVLCQVDGTVVIYSFTRGSFRIGSLWFQGNFLLHCPFNFVQEIVKREFHPHQLKLKARLYRCSPLDTILSSNMHTWYQVYDKTVRVPDDLGGFCIRGYLWLVSRRKAHPTPQTQESERRRRWNVSSPQITLKG